MRNLIVAVCVFGFIVSQVAASLLFRLTAQSDGKTALWFFIWGNVVGFLCPVTLTFALRGTNPNVIYALCYGLAFFILQFASWHFFKQPLSPWQWTGVCLVGAGVLLLQVR